MAEQVELTQKMETKMEKEGALEEGLVDFDAYSVCISWADQLEAVYPLEDTAA